MKYIIFEENETPCGALLFPVDMMHSTIGIPPPVGSWNVRSAGFCSIGQDEDYRPSFKCYGESLSLNIKSLGKKDEEFLNQRFRQDH